MKKVLIFNAPPQSGKDTAANYISKLLNANQMSFKQPMHEMVSKILGIETDVFLEGYEKLKKDPDFRITIKSISPVWEFTLREFYIHISEHVMKPVFGKGFFGVYAGRKLQEGWNVFSDGGFIEEITPLLKYTDQLYVCKIHRDGCSFVDDSRGWLPDSAERPSKKVTNNSSIADFEQELFNYVQFLTEIK